MSDVTEDSTEENGTNIFFEPDNTLFYNYSFQNQFVETLLRNYTYLNTGLTFIYNGQRIVSRHGLEDLLKDNMTSEGLYDIIHLKGEDIEIAFTHTNQYGEEYYSFVNGQQWVLPHNTPQMLQSAVMMGNAIDHEDVRNLSFVYMVIALIGSLVSVPVWSAMGLM